MAVKQITITPAEGGTLHYVGSNPETGDARYGYQPKGKRKMIAPPDRIMGRLLRQKAFHGAETD